MAARGYTEKLVGLTALTLGIYTLAKPVNRYIPATARSTAKATRPKYSIYEYIFYTFNLILYAGSIYISLRIPHSLGVRD